MQTLTVQGPATFFCVFQFLHQCIEASSQLTQSQVFIHFTAQFRLRLKAGHNMSFTSLPSSAFTKVQTEKETKRQKDKTDRQKTDGWKDETDRKRDRQG